MHAPHRNNAYFTLARAKGNHVRSCANSAKSPETAFTVLFAGIFFNQGMSEVKFFNQFKTKATLCFVFVAFGSVPLKNAAILTLSRNIVCTFILPVNYYCIYV